MGSEADANLGGRSVFENVIEGFFDGHEEVVAFLGGDGAIGQSGGQIHPAANAAVLEIFLRVLKNVIGKIVERIVFGIDGPNDFIHSLDNFAGGFGDVLDMSFAGANSGGFAVHQFGDHGDFGK